MPSLTAKRIKGKIYYYLRECQRVDGKPKIVWQQYLGSAQQLLQRMVPPQPQSALIRDYGTIVAPSASPSSWTWCPSSTVTSPNGAQAPPSDSTCWWPA